MDCCPHNRDILGVYYIGDPGSIQPTTKAPYLSQLLTRHTLSSSPSPAGPQMLPPCTVLRHSPALTPLWHYIQPSAPFPARRALWTMALAQPPWPTVNYTSTPPDLLYSQILASPASPHPSQNSPIAIVTAFLQSSQTPPLLCLLLFLHQLPCLQQSMFISSLRESISHSQGEY